MPKSRGRRSKRSQRECRGSARGRPPGARFLYDEDLRRNFQVMFAADEAEARGDAKDALRIMSELPEEGFWRPWRLRALGQMTLFGPLLPRWATSRWILAQALQHLEVVPTSAARGRVRRSLDIAIELRGGAAALPGRDQTDARCRVMDHDWVYRQVHLYEMGGLRHFIQRVASADLLAGADRIDEWALTPMGGFRLVSRDAGTVGWHDLARDETVVTPNIGSSVLVVPGEHVIGRLVPVENGVMFEGPPLMVPGDAAEQVARDPESWIDVLRSVRAEGGSGDVFHAAGDVRGLLNDTHPFVWMNGLIETCTWPDPRSLPTSEQTARATLNLARLALDGCVPDYPEAIDPWACVSAALLDPTNTLALQDVVGQDDLLMLIRLADLLAEPAATICRAIVGIAAEAA